MSEDRAVLHPAFAAALLSPAAVALAAEIAAAKGRADRLGIHDEALRLARTTGYSYRECVDHLALAIAVPPNATDGGQ